MTDNARRRQSPLIPEFKVSNIDANVRFYTEVLGFRVVYDRPEDNFAYLEREGAEMMLEQADGLADVAGAKTGAIVGTIGVHDGCARLSQ